MTHWANYISCNASSLDMDSCFELAKIETLIRIADALEKQVEIAQKTLDRIHEIK